MSSEIVDRDQLLSLRDLREPGEPDLVVEIVSMFQTDSSARLARAQTALASRDAQALRFEAHALRGSAGVIGAGVLAEAAQKVERCAETPDLPGIDGLVDDMASAIAAVMANLATLVPEGPRGAVSQGGGL